MFIETEMTPNPDTIKFLPGREVMADGSANFPDKVSADKSPLATDLFRVEDITGVFLGYDFVAVTKQADSSWDVLKPIVLTSLMQFFSSGRAVIDGDMVADESTMTDREEDAEIIAQIKDILEQQVRPAVAADGGDIVYHGYFEGVVYLQMQGACAGCPSSTITLKHGIENLLKHYVPEVIEVRST